MGSKILAIMLVALTVLALLAPIIARTSIVQGYREHLTRIEEDLAEEWADRAPRLEELIFVRIARAIVFLIDLMD